MIGFLQSPVPHDTTNQNLIGVAGSPLNNSPFDPNIFGAYQNQASNTGAWFVPPRVDYNSSAHLSAVAATLGDYAVQEQRAAAHKQPAPKSHFIDQVAMTASRGKSNGTRSN